MTVFRVNANGPFDHAAAIAVLAAHRIEGRMRVDVESAAVTRLFTVDDAVHAASCELDPGGVTISTNTVDDGVVEVIAGEVERWFDLATDLGPINAHLATDPLFAGHVADHPGLRITGSPEPFEAVVQTVLGQQVTLSAGRLFGARLVAAFGTPAPNGLLTFPTPRTLARVPVDDLQSTLRLTGARARTVHGVADFFAARPSSATLPPRSELAGLYGIGPWTLDYLAVRAGGDPDAFPHSDAVLRRMMRKANRGDDADARWRPFRSYAAARLWALSGALD